MLFFFVCHTRVFYTTARTMLYIIILLGKLLVFPWVKILKTVTRVVVQTLECSCVCWVKSENRPRVCQKVLVWVSCGALVPLVVFLLCSCNALTSVVFHFKPSVVRHCTTTTRAQQDGYTTNTRHFCNRFFGRRVLDRSSKIRAALFLADCLAVSATLVNASSGFEDKARVPSRPD